MKNNLSLTFYLNIGTWITIALCLSLWRVSSAAPNCTLIDDVLNCELNTNSDFENLSSVAENIRLTFKQGNSVSFEDSLFPFLPVLRTLTVDLRYINDLSTGAFKQLSNLENLQLENSDIYRPLPVLQLKSGTLTGLTALKTFNITEIGLTQIENGAFQDLTNLTHSRIVRNKVQSLPDSVFATTKLETVTLSDMEQIQVSSTTFQGLKNLKTFQFSHSRLQSLGPSVFSDMTNLQEMKLENNELRTLSTETFKGLNNLDRLYLKNNNLTTLEYGVFSDLTKLTTLDITYSDIEVRHVTTLILLLYITEQHNTKAFPWRDDYEIKPQISH